MDYTVDIKSEFHPYKLLLTQARWASKQLEEDKSNERHFVISTIIFSAFSLESATNSFGSKLFNDWDKDYEQMSTQGKVRLITEQLNISFNRIDKP